MGVRCCWNQLQDNPPRVAGVLADWDAILAGSFTSEAATVQRHSLKDSGHGAKVFRLRKGWTRSRLRGGRIVHDDDCTQRSSHLPVGTLTSSA